MPLTTRRLLEESPLIALLLLFWYVTSWIGTAAPGIPSAVRTAGFVMAALFAVVRGVALADDAVPVFTDPTPESVLYQNGRALLAAAPWFLAALVVELLASLWRFLGLFGLFTSPDSTLIGILGGTGTLVVVVFAVATGVASVRDGYIDSSSSSPE